MAFRLKFRTTLQTGDFKGVTKEDFDFKWGNQGILDKDLYLVLHTNQIKPMKYVGKFSPKNLFLLIKSLFPDLSRCQVLLDENISV